MLLFFRVYNLTTLITFDLWYLSVYSHRCMLNVIGFLDIDTTGYVGRRSSIDGTMYCMYGYSAHCDISPESWSCQNTEDLCNDPWALRFVFVDLHSVSSS